MYVTTFSTAKYTMKVEMVNYINNQYNILTVKTYKGPSSQNSWTVTKAFCIDIIIIIKMFKWPRRCLVAMQQTQKICYKSGYKSKYMNISTIIMTIESKVIAL